MDKTPKYNELFKKIDNRIQLIKEFENQEKYYSGEILIPTVKEDLIFVVKIPLGYPLGNANTSIIFVCNQINGYEHQNLDNSICLHPEANEHIETKLKNEINLLLNWIQNYYIEEKPDDTYNYLLHDYEKVCMFFDNSITELTKGSYGEFSYIEHSHNFDYTNLIITEIAQKKSSWSNIYFNTETKGYGVWYFCEEEPIKKRREIAFNWCDLDKYIQVEFISQLYNYQLDLKHKKIDYFFFMLGYYIPVEDGTEIHWELIKVPTSEQFSVGKKVPKTKPIKWQSVFSDLKITWCKSINIDYNRFFGRGKLHSTITEADILIIGIGAIGSSVATSLTRGGAKKITLCDYDTVEAGNICRSEYFLNQCGENKFVSLIHQLQMISPFVQIEFIPIINKQLKGNPKYYETKQLLSNYDIIFDCSTDMEMALTIDNAELKCDIFNLSITNEAKEFACFFGGHTIKQNKAMFFESLNNSTIDLDFYPEIGCGYPTFKANYNDIQALLNFALKQINLRYTQGLQQNSFALKAVTDELNYRIEIYGI